MADLKQCRDCGEIKPIGDFYMNKGLPQNPCKSCTCEKRRLEYADFPEKIKHKNMLSYSRHRENRLAAMAEYRRENKEAVSQAKKDWWRIHRHTKLIDRRKKWRENRGKNLLIAKQWRDKNKEWIKKYNLEYNRNNSERIKQNSHAYYLANKDRLIKLAYEWRANNREAYKNWKKAWSANYRVKRREYLAEKQGRRNKALSGGFTPEESVALFLSQKGLCNICETDITGNYHHDHIVPLIKGGSNKIQNIQLLCPTCNLKKGAMDNDEFILRLNGASNVR